MRLPVLLVAKAGQIDIRQQYSGVGRVRQTFLCGCEEVGKAEIVFNRYGTVDDMANPFQIFFVQTKLQTVFKVEIELDPVIAF